MVNVTEPRPLTPWSNKSYTTRPMSDPAREIADLLVLIQHEQMVVATAYARIQEHATHIADIATAQHGDWPQCSKLLGMQGN